MVGRNLRIASLGFCLLLGGCNPFSNPFVGKSYVNASRTGYYEFVSKEDAEYSLIPSETVVCCSLPEIGVSYLTCSQDLTGYDNFYVARSSSGYLSFYAIKSNVKISVNGSGVISPQAGSDTPADAIVYVTPNHSIGSISQHAFAEMALRHNSATFFGVAYSSTGSPLESKEALDRMLASTMSDDNSGFGAVSFYGSHQLTIGKKRVIALVPYEVSSTTLSLDWKKANLSENAMITNLDFRDYLDNMMTRELVIFRIEDDGKFLYNPETGNRFKQE